MSLRRQESVKARVTPITDLLGAGARGIVFGEMEGCSVPNGSEEGLDAFLLRALPDFDGPIVAGLPVGHGSLPVVTLPLGVGARLRAEAGEAQFEVLEEATA